MRKQTLLILLMCFQMVAFQMPAAEETGPLIVALNSENEEERKKAINALKQMGEAALLPLMKAEADEKLGVRQLIILRKIIGDRLVESSPLTTVDLTKLAPFGEDKAKGIVGNPDLLINRDSKTVVMNGEFVLEQGPLEYVIVIKHPNAKSHESIVGVYPVPRDICYALLACEYTYAGEMTEDGKINLPREAGILISVEYEWEPVHANLATPGAAVHPGKKWVRVPVEYFAWNAQTEKVMRRSPFAFTGSKFEKGEKGKMDFMADIEKSVVALRFDPYAILNTLLDTKEIDPQHAAGYSINRFAVPSRGTKCRVVFEPWSGGELTKTELKDTVEGKAQNPSPPPQK